MFWLLRAIAFVVARVPLRVRGAFAFLLAIVAGGHRRTHVEAAMRRAGLSSTHHATPMYRRLAKGIFELLTLSAHGAKREAMIAAVTSADRERLGAAFRSGEPVVIFASHTGNWELVAAAAARWVRQDRQRDLVVVAKPLHSRGFDRFMRRLRSLLGVRTIEPEGALLHVMNELRAGNVVVMPIDQAPTSSSAIVTSFLGQDAFVDRAPAVIAHRAKATVLVVAADRHNVHLLDRYEPRALSIDETSRAATIALDRFVRAHPAEWLWIHRRWKRHAAIRERGPVDTQSASRTTTVGAPALHSARS